MKANRLRILCAEDDTLLGEVLVRLFRQRGHLVEHAPDGATAWLRLSAHLSGFDVLITDHQMPAMSGLMLAERLRRAGFTGQIVLYSSSVTPELTASYRACGVAAIVTKSARPDALIAAIETLPPSV